MTLSSVSFCAALAFALWSVPVAVGAAESARADSLIVAASEFVHLLPKGDLLADSRPGEPRMFNNFALVLQAPAPAAARVTVPAAGTYRLWVRSGGRSHGRFKVTIDGRTTTETFGDPAATWQDGGSFELAAGPLEVRLTDIVPAPVFEVLVLTRNPDFKEADLLPRQFATEAELLKDYKIPPAHAVKFGDVTGDGRMDFLVLQPDYSATMFDHDGKKLWHYAGPAENTRLRAEFEAPGSVWDFDQDGRAEVVHWRMIDGKEWIVMADGCTGAVKHRVEWPAKPWPHVYNNFRTAIARLHPGHPQDLVVLCDSGDSIAIAAYDSTLRLLWSVNKPLKKDHLGHYVYPVDVDGNGLDEVFVGHVGFDAQGRELWNNLGLFPDNHDHVDSYRFADLDGDGQLEALAGLSDVGTVVLRARTGQPVWLRRSDHTQQITFGQFLAGRPGPQVVVNGRIYGNRALGEPYLSAVLHWFGPKGESLGDWPRTPLNGNPDFAKGDWRGDGRAEVFWFKFHLNPDGRGTLYFAEEVYHMFDFMGNGAEQVICLNKRLGILQIYGCRGVRPKVVARDADYLRHSVANHTHY